MAIRQTNIEARLARLERQWTQQVRPDILRNAKGRCACCNFYCPYILEVHHIKAVSKGGTSIADNLVGLCPNCHAIVEKMRSGMLDNPYFHDWIRDELDEEIYLRAGKYAGFVLAESVEPAE